MQNESHDGGDSSGVFSHNKDHAEQAASLMRHHAWHLAWEASYSCLEPSGSHSVSSACFSCHKSQISTQMTSGAICQKLPAAKATRVRHRRIRYLRHGSRSREI